MPQLETSAWPSGLCNQAELVLVTSGTPCSGRVRRGKSPKTYGYWLDSKEILVQMALYGNSREPVREPLRGEAKTADDIFLAHRLVWRRQASDLSAAVITQHNAPFGYKDAVSPNPSALISTDSEAEAHYLGAITNPNPARDFTKSFAFAGRGFCIRLTNLACGDPRSRSGRSAALEAYRHLEHVLAIEVGEQRTGDRGVRVCQAAVTVSLLG